MPILKVPTRLTTAAGAHKKWLQLLNTAEEILKDDKDLQKMVRTYKPKTDRKNINEENIEDAIREVLSKTLSIRKAADKYSIQTATLQHRIEKARKSFEATRILSTNEASSSLQAESSLSQEESSLSQAGPSSPQIAPSMEMAKIASSSAHTTTAALSSHTATATSSNIYGSKYTVAQVFSIEQEKALTQYLLNCSKMHYGITLRQLLTLAYEFAESSGCNYPKPWKKTNALEKIGQLASGRETQN
ncbi:unnamed protein product [Danaus chrysippus]|uniref:(African queen) hypothetical protein n=1 Tax=Danaus chrysippus TaxID=151541 RepID=A0A8J2R1Y2_9NEOP|nr:unnamed protein product [Danaus chrysippus]